MFALFVGPAIYAIAHAQAKESIKPMKLTPLHISLLIDYLTDSKFPYNCGAPAVVEYTNDLLREGLINCCFPAAAGLVRFRGYAGSPHPYAGTTKGRALLDRLCKTPIDVAEYLKQVHGGDEIARLKRQDAAMTKVYEGMVALGWKPASQDDCTFVGDNRAEAILKFVKDAQKQIEVLKADLKHEQDRGSAWSLVRDALCVNGYIKTPGNFSGQDTALWEIKRLQARDKELTQLQSSHTSCRSLQPEEPKWKPGYFVHPGHNKDRLIFATSKKGGKQIASREQTSHYFATEDGHVWPDSSALEWERDCKWQRVEAPFWYKTGESSGVAVLSDDVRVEFDGPTAPLPCGVTMGAFLKAIANPI